MKTYQIIHNNKYECSPDGSVTLVGFNKTWDLQRKPKIIFYEKKKVLLNQFGLWLEKKVDHNNCCSFPLIWGVQVNKLLSLRYFLKMACDGICPLTFIFIKYTKTTTQWKVLTITVIWMLFTSCWLQIYRVHQFHFDSSPLPLNTVWSNQIRETITERSSNMSTSCIKIKQICGGISLQKSGIKRKILTN